MKPLLKFHKKQGLLDLAETLPEKPSQECTKLVQFISCKHIAIRKAQQESKDQFIH